ncbi:MAG: FAD-dependent oxidoreductase [Planctomycetota bacterium]|nr:MAG: FAD-dependent oxidoreductase [Planctomycetota bacterium]
MRVAVIGAGPAGLTAAYQLAKSGVEVEVFEASSGVGGLARSMTLWGQTVDLGPHRFFSSDARVNRLWLEVVGRDYQMVDRTTRIYYRGRFFDYPLSAANALRNLGPREAVGCLASYLRQQCRCRPPQQDDASFEDWVVQRFGRRLFEVFFKSYSEKLWGMPCSELDADFAAERIKKLSLAEAVKNACGLGRGKHRTLVDRFAYPTAGTGMVYERMAEYIRGLGGEVHLDRPVRRVLVEGNRARGVEELWGDERKFDHVISTMPLTLMTKNLPGVPEPVRRAAEQLKFRNTILAYLLVDQRDLFPDQWLYVHSPELLVGRVTNFRNWVPTLCNSFSETILSLEYWCNDTDQLWQQSDDDLIRRAGIEMVSTGLLGRSRVLDGYVVRVKRCYPVCARGYKRHVQTITDHLDSIRGLSVIGRYGAFQYNNQDHSILMGMLAAENVLEAKRHNLWGVNAGLEPYPESAVIGDEGLVAAEA